MTDKLSREEAMSDLEYGKIVLKKGESIICDDALLYGVVKPYVELVKLSSAKAIVNRISTTDPKEASVEEAVEEIKKVFTAEFHAWNPNAMKPIRAIITRATDTARREALEGVKGEIEKECESDGDVIGANGALKIIDKAIEETK